MLNFPRWKIWLTIGVCVAGVLLSLPSLFSRKAMDSLPSWIPHNQVHLGLDLQGGSYLLLQIDMETVIKERLETLLDQVRTSLRTGDIGYVDLVAEQRSVRFQVRDPQQVERAVDLVDDLATMVGGQGGLGAALGGAAGGRPDLVVTTEAGSRVVMTLSEQALEERSSQAVAQSIEIVRRRIDETGINEPSIARQGANRILVQLPGVDDPDRIKRLLGKTAKMTFRLLHPTQEVTGGRVPPGTELLDSAERDRRSGIPQKYLVRKRVEVDGASLSNASAGNNTQSGQWVVNFEFDSVGAQKFANVTKANVGRPFAIVLDNKVISAPVIREPILGGRGQISGSFTVQDANDLAVLLRAGALPAPLTIVEERTVGPDLGADAIQAGIWACLIGAVLVVAYMVASYGLFGIIANIVLFFNMILIFGILSVLQATLTLPGIAGLVLTLGMAVDANVLINERIREEYRKGRSPFASMEAGFDRALSAIIDGNLTTLITMVLLYGFGAGPVRGFAVTVSIGILTTLFCGVMLSELLMVTWLRRSRATTLPV